MNEFLDSQRQWLAKAKSQSEIEALAKKNNQILFRAIVVEVDRLGGQFADSDRGMAAPIFSLRGRLITGLRDNTGSTEDSLSLLPIFYPLQSIANIALPEVGETVWVVFDNNDSNNKIGYWLSICTPPVTQFDYNVFTKKSTGIEFGPDLADIYKYGGDVPVGLSADRTDISPSPIYSPFPSRVQIKPGDVISIGRSNTRIQQSFNSEDAANKSGYIELATETLYIQNDEDKHNTKFDKLFRQGDIFKNTDTREWQFMNVSGCRFFMATKANADKLLIDHNTEKDGTGQYGNVQKKFDKHFFEDGPKDGSKVGSGDVKKENIQDTVDYSDKANDVISAQADKRNTMLWDSNEATTLIEGDIINLITRQGGDTVQHAVKGEDLIRLLIRMNLNILYLTRLLDQVRDRLNKLGNDFRYHGHSLLPGQSMAPTGSTKEATPIPIIYENAWYDNTTGDVGSDSPDSLDEKGSDDTFSGDYLKKRIKELRNQVDQIIKDSSKVLSLNIRLN